MHKGEFQARHTAPASRVSDERREDWGEGEDKQSEDQGSGTATMPEGAEEGTGTAGTDP